MKLAALILALAAIASPQSATVLLQRAIYLEETAGDIDGAIAIYRQILATPGDARTYEAEAQYHLGACLLKKGNKAQAARVFQILMQKYPEETHLVAKASIRYQDPLIGYAITVPEGWAVHSRKPRNGGPGECTDLQDPETTAIIIICAKPENLAPDAIEARLLAGHQETAQQRRAQLRNYTLRPGSPFPGTVGNQRSLTHVADYSIGGNPMVEWATWVQTEHTRSSVIVHLRAADFDNFRLRFAPILESFRLP